MEFVKGNLYQISNDVHLEGCVLEFKKEKDGLLAFNVIKGNDNYMDFYGDIYLSRKYFECGTVATPLVRTEDDIEPEEEKFDEIQKASHYNQGIEAIDYIESHNMNFNEVCYSCKVQRDLLKGLKKS